MLNNLLEKSCEKHADKIALLFSGKNYSYHQLKVMTHTLAYSFIHLNIKPGDKVAFFLTNCPEAILCFLACFKVGAIVVPINQFFKHDKLAAVLNETKPKILITEQNLFTELLKIPKQLLEQIDCYLIDGKVDAGNTIKSFDQLINHTNQIGNFPHFQDNTIATLSYTSGSTGKPKGVMHNQAQLYEFLTSHAAHVSYTSDDRILSYVPIAFGYCFSNQILPGLYSGASISLVPAGHWNKILDSIQHDNVTLTYVGPTTFFHWLNALKQRPAFNHNLRAVISAGDAMPPALHRRVKQILNITIYECIGMSETWLYAANPLNEKRKLGSMGPVCKNMRVKIIDDNENTLSYGETGQIAVKGDSVMMGYYSGDKESNSVKNGWFYTGDCGYLDEDGYLYYRGRKELSFVKHNVTIFPHEIEFALYEHPAILEAGVTHIVPPGEDIKIIAYVSINPVMLSVDEDHLMNHLARLLPKIKLPDKIIILSELPKGITGKIDRKLLGNV